MFRDNVPIFGAVRVLEILHDGSERIISAAKNLLVTVGRDELAHALVKSHPVYAGSADVYPRYIGMGTGTTAAAAGDTALQTPVNAASGSGGTTFKQFTSIVFPGATGAVKLVTLYSGSEVFTGLREIGLFSGILAAGDPPTITGLKLISRYISLGNIDKASSSKIQVEWTLTVQQGS